MQYLGGLSVVCAVQEPSIPVKLINLTQCTESLSLLIELLNVTTNKLSTCTLSSHYHFQIIPSHYTLKPLPFPNYSLVYFFWGNCPITIYYLACPYQYFFLIAMENS
jgi:hypothetical protein